jgi:hypothetical protein
MSRTSQRRRDGDAAPDGVRAVAERLRPTPATRVRSAAGLLVLLTVLGIVTALAVTVAVVLAVLAINNAL